MLEFTQIKRRFFAKENKIVANERKEEKKKQFCRNFK